MLSSYLKTSDVIEMVGVMGTCNRQIFTGHLSKIQSLHLLWQSWDSFSPVIFSSADLNCFRDREYLVVTTFETRVQQIFKGFL